MYDEIFKSLFEIVAFLNRPNQDRLLLKRAGVELDTALFPLLIRVGMKTAMSVGELAEQTRRDHSTVSRQIDKLEVMGLVYSDNSKQDKRKRAVGVTDQGRAAVTTISAARRALMKEALSDWNMSELQDLNSDLQKLVQTMSTNSAL